MDLAWRASKHVGARTKVNVFTRQTSKSPPWNYGAHGITIKVVTIVCQCSINSMECLCKTIIIYTRLSVTHS